MTRLRLYAIVRVRKSPALPLGLGGERLRLLRYGRLALVVGAARTPVEPTRANLIAHDCIVRTLAESSVAILPARFGVIAESARELKAEIADRAEVLNGALELVAGRVQMTLRLPAVTKGPGTNSRSSGKKYLESRAAALAASFPFPSAIRKQLAAIVRAERIDAAPSAGMVIYHLIDRRAVGRYRKLVRKGASGPFPPYAFAPSLITP